MKVTLKDSQTEREGYDYFYNRATGKNESCSDKCDLPSQYKLTCQLNCRYYIPKERATIQPTRSIEDYIEEDQYQIYILFAVLALCIVIIVIVLVYCFRKKLSKLIVGFRERLCETLTQAQIETGQESVNSHVDQARYQPVGQHEQN